MKAKRKDFVVEYSQSQRAFHIQPLSAAIEANCRRFWQRPTEMFDWIVVYKGTRRQCEIIVNQSEKRLQREEAPVQWMH